MLICKSLTTSGKKNLILESQSQPGDIFVPTGKTGKPAAFDVVVTSSLQSNSLTNAAAKAGYAIDAADERKYCLHDDNCAKMGIKFVPLAIEVLGGISATFKKTLKRLAVLSDNRSFQAQGLSVAFCKLWQSPLFGDQRKCCWHGLPSRLFCFLGAPPLGGEMVDSVLLLSLSTDMIKGSASMILTGSFWPDLTNSE